MVFAFLFLEFSPTHVGKDDFLRAEVLKNDVVVSVVFYSLNLRDTLRPILGAI